MWSVAWKFFLENRQGFFLFSISGLHNALQTLLAIFGKFTAAPESTITDDARLVHGNSGIGCSTYCIYPEYLDA